MYPGAYMDSRPCCPSCAVWGEIMLEIWFEPAWIESFGCETSIDSFKVSYRGLTCLEWELTDDLKKSTLLYNTPDAPATVMRHRCRTSRYRIASSRARQL